MGVRVVERLWVAADALVVVDATRFVGSAGTPSASKALRFSMIYISKTLEQGSSNLFGCSYTDTRLAVVN